MDDLDGEDNSELERLDFLDAIGADQHKYKKDFGRERGLNPTPSEAHKKAVDRLAAKLTWRSDSKVDDEIEPFDITSRPRVILYEGRVQKKSHSSMVQHSSRKNLYLLNDVLLIATVQNSSSIMNFSSEKLLVTKVLNLDHISFADMSLMNSEENSCAFEIRTEDRPYLFIAESESDKRIWLEELEAAIFCILMSSTTPLSPGWRHNVVRGTLHSAALRGDLELLKMYTKKLQGSALDVQDEGGMSPLHLASLSGHFAAVELLLDNGANVDELNQGLNTALMLAVSQGHEDIAFLLIERDTDLNVRNLKDRDALFMTVLYGHESKGLYNILLALTRKDVNLNQKDMSGATPLHECASRNLWRPVQMLVDAGADVNTKHGRNGLTPLQVACSIDKLDVETVRSFLDKGSHPNWKNAAMKSAFDIALTTHLVVPGKAASDGNSKAAMTEVALFAQNVLPVLMEIVRKGGRYTEETLEGLRPSFKDAINSARMHWNNQVEPPYFYDYVTAKGPNDVCSSYWTSNSAYKHCQLCLDLFTYAKRRHHCRCCGSLCCAVCSTKRLRLCPKLERGASSPGASSSSSSSSSPSDSADDRVCDGCFNRLVSEAFTRHQLVTKAKKELDKQEAARQLELEAAATSENKFGVKSVKSSSGLSSPGSSSKTDMSSAAGTTSAAAAASDAMDALNERGERLHDLSDKSDILKEASSDYNRMAKQLLRQQQQKSVW